MKPFLDQNFLLTSQTAIHLYHNYASKLPIIDYHCHISPKDIAMDVKFENITKLWLGGDHYKWRLMRACGVKEKYITGNAPDKDKFFMWTRALSRAIGNPLYHWSHLELQRYFGYNGVLNETTAQEVWDLCNKKLADMSAHEIIKKSNVTDICTTDDPVDCLEWHKKIMDSSLPVNVYPAWRPDKAMNIEADDYIDYLGKLSEAAEVKIDSYDALQNALKKRMEFFKLMGCRVSDHGLDYVMYVPATRTEINEIFNKRLQNKTLSEKEVLQFKTAFLINMGRRYHDLGWVMQLHYGCKRNNNTKAFLSMGADTGYDCINDYTPSAQLSAFLNALASLDQLPKTIVYSLNPIDNAAIDTVIACFQDESAVCKIQHGSAWWFNDNKNGMREQLTSLANLGYLGGFVGMLTDSRSFLSYTRHEYFRRILCDLLGTWVENGEYPQDYNVLGELVADISYNNAKKYFGFDSI